MRLRRRLLRLAILSVVVPIALEAMDTVADRLESTKGPTTTSRSLRRASDVGHWAAKR